VEEEFPCSGEIALCETIDQYAPLRKSAQQSNPFRDTQQFHLRFMLLE
jgi:hypothetical protein